MEASVSSDSVLERLIKVVLTHVLRVSQVTQHPSSLTFNSIFNDCLLDTKPGEFSNNLAAFLWQYSAYDLLTTILISYSFGIAQNIKKHIDNILIPNDIFVVGKSILHNLVHFKTINFHHGARSPSGQVFNSVLFESLDKLLIDNDLDGKQAQTLSKLNQWTIVGELIKIFEFDPAIQQEITLSLHPMIKDCTLKFLADEMAISGELSNYCRVPGSNWTREDGLYNRVIFGILRRVYLPLTL
jgi:hypothetical protein